MDNNKILTTANLTCNHLLIQGIDNMVTHMCTDKGLCSCRQDKLTGRMPHVVQVICLASPALGSHGKETICRTNFDLRRAQVQMYQLQYLSRSASAITAMLDIMHAMYAILYNSLSWQLLRGNIFTGWYQCPVRSSTFMACRRTLASSSCCDSVSWQLVMLELLPELRSHTTPC